MEATGRGQLPSLPEDQLRPSQALKATQMLQTPSASSNNAEEGSQDPPKLPARTPTGPATQALMTERQ